MIRSDLLDVSQRFGDKRRTEILPDSDGSLNEEDLIANIPLFVTVTERGYAKRLPAATYRAQGRGGKGVTGIKTRDEDSVMHAFTCLAHDDLLFFTNKGKVYQQRAFEIPDASRVAKGVPLINIIQINPDERVTTIIPVRDWEKADYFVMLTEQGRIKRVALDQFQNVRTSGLIAINLDEGDHLRWVKMTHGDNDVLIVTELGQAIRFGEDDVRPMGRTAAGVMAIRLEDEDRVAAMDVCRNGCDLLVITSNGYGKRTPVEEYTRQNRYGKGVRTFSRDVTVTGQIVEARIVQIGDEITLISAEGMVMRTSVESIAQYGRSTRGVRVMNLKGNDRIVSMALMDEMTLRYTSHATEPGAGEVQVNGGAPSHTPFSGEAGEDALRGSNGHAQA